MSTAPTTELGQTENVTASALFGGNDTNGWIEETERLADWRFPTSIETVDRMRNDAQVFGLYVALALPIRRFRWMLNARDADPARVQLLSEDLGLPILGEKVGAQLRTRDRFSFDDHLRHALLAPLYGLYNFEQVGRMDMVNDLLLWRLRKLAPRTPQMLSEVKVAKDGGLVSIKQAVGYEAPEIPVSRLVAYCWDREGGNWYGRSLLRPLFGSWRAKRELVATDVIKHKRNGQGVPVAEETAQDALSTVQAEKAQAVASAYRAGDFSGAFMPWGSRLRLLGVEGTLPDTLASIRYHDQQMSSAWNQEVRELGQTPNGSRALGDTLEGNHFAAQDLAATWFTSIFNAHVVEDYWDWNFGETDPAPELIYQRDENPELSIADLATAVEKGLVVADPELQDYLRERYHLPAIAATGITVPAVPAVPSAPLGAPVAARRPAPSKDRAPIFTAARAQLDEPTELRRELFDHEILSGADFEGIDGEFRTQLDQLLSTWEEVTGAEIDDVVDQVRAATSLEDLAAVQAAAAGSEVLAEAMRNVAAAGAEQARAEARAQGVDVDEPDLAAVNTSLEQRAAATDVLLARSLSEAGGRRALSMAGGATANEAIADGVRDHLESLSTAYLVDRLGGAVQTAQNYGRSAAMAEAQAAAGGAKFYASEILDANTCPPCADIDGHEFADFDDMNANYATGGYVHCDGGERCRGTAVAVYDEG